jgi:hypothetical protein
MEHPPCQLVWKCLQVTLNNLVVVVGEIHRLEITVLLTPASEQVPDLQEEPRRLTLEWDGPGRGILILIRMRQDTDPACFVPEQREANMTGLWDRYIFWEE